MHHPPGPTGASYAQQTRRPQDPLHFSKGSDRFAKMFEQGMSENCVKMAIWKRESVNARHFKRSIRLRLSRSILSTADLARLEIDSKHLSRRDKLR